MMRRRALGGLPLLCVPATAGAEALAPVAIALAEFLAGVAVDEAARRDIAAEAARDAAAAPGAARAAAEQGRALLERARTASPQGRAALRERAMAGLWLGPNADHGSALTRAVVARNPVLAEDRATGLLVTERGWRALLASNRFVAGLVGQPPPAEREVVAARADLPRGFPALDRNRQALFAEAESRWEALRARWEALAPAQRETLARDLRPHVTSPALVPVAARTLEQAALAGQARAELRDHAAQLIRRWDMRAIGAAQGTLHGMSGALGSFN
jgi:hypothetical protein